MNLEQRSSLIKAARTCLNQGGSIAAFARENKVPRTTVMGWLKGHDNPRGRPRKVEVFNEIEVLQRLMARDGLQNWATVREEFRNQSGELLARRTVFHVLAKWGIVRKWRPGSNLLILHASEFRALEQLNGNSAQARTLWQILSRRGSEGFVLTPGNTQDDLNKVVRAFQPALVGRRQRLQTNHEGLYKLLENDCSIELASPSLALQDQSPGTSS